MNLNWSDVMNRKALLDLYFVEARARLIDLAAFLDRLERAEGEGDVRLAALTQALAQLDRPEPIGPNACCLN